MCEKKKKQTQNCTFLYPSYKSEAGKTVCQFRQRDAHRFRQRSAHRSGRHHERQSKVLQKTLALGRPHVLIRGFLSSSLVGFQLLPRNQPRSVTPLALYSHDSLACESTIVVTTDSSIYLGGLSFPQSRGALFLSAGLSPVVFYLFNPSRSPFPCTSTLLRVSVHPVISPSNTSHLATT